LIFSLSIKLRWFSNQT